MKSPLSSKTILAGAAVVIVSVLSLFGIAVSAEDTAAVVDSGTRIWDAVSNIIALVGGVVVIVGRYRAKQTIAGSKAAAEVGPKLQLLLVAALGSFALNLAGCAAIEPGNDPVLVNAERTTQLALDTFDAIEKTEYDAYAGLKATSPETAKTIRIFVNKLRTDSPDWLTSARRATEAYRLNRTEDNKANLQTAIAVLQVAIDEARRYLTLMQKHNASLPDRKDSRLCSRVHSPIYSSEREFVALVVVTA